MNSRPDYSRSSLEFNAPYFARCSPLMRYEKVIISDGQSCESWTCAKCGDVIDEGKDLQQAGAEKAGLGGKFRHEPCLPLSDEEVLSWGKSEGRRIVAVYQG